MSEKFLSHIDLVELTGRIFKSKQIEVLRKQGIPFRLNASGRPVVTWASVNGTKETVKNTQQWEPLI